ncbi:hypothetical protein A9Q89_07260 [Gammaproteobacteria bacterium 53_120_T64]|nr:hypothetical protein A9Q89_07260 [Gammaproteobacteria bacterium 53_120_T64]
MHFNPQHMEIEQIYSRLLSCGQRALSICAANPGEGVTSVALALAQRNLLAGKSTLLVDFNCYRPTLKPLLSLGGNSAKHPEEMLFSAAAEPQLLGSAEGELAITGIPCPQRREFIMTLRKPGMLEQCIEQWLQNYDSILFDTSALNRSNGNNIPPERVAAACDGAVLVVLAGSTTEAMAASAITRLQDGGAQLLACIYNDRDNPSLKNELLRELNRLEPRFKGIVRYLGAWLRNNRLLAMSI